MRLIKPKRLRSGDVIGICAPASSARSPELLNAGISYLERNGFRVEIGTSATKRHGYLAGTDQERSDDLNRFFANRNVKAIFTVRGGYGVHRILPLLDYSLIRRHPKIVVGYSDITALHSALLVKAGLISFSGPMVAVDMAKGLSGRAEERFWDCLMSATPPASLHGHRLHSHTSTHIRATTGRIVGGNLSVLSALVGTPYFPTIPNPLFILEDIDERPYRVDRMLHQLLLAGELKKSRGIVLGDFSTCVPEEGKPSLTVRQIINDVTVGTKTPVLFGIRFGHTTGSVPFPIGVRVRLDSRKNRIEFLESGVS